MSEAANSYISGRLIARITTTVPDSALRIFVVAEHAHTQLVTCTFDAFLLLGQEILASHNWLFLTCLISHSGFVDTVLH